MLMWYFCNYTVVSDVKLLFVFSQQVSYFNKSCVYSLFSNNNKFDNLLFYIIYISFIDVFDYTFDFKS